MRYAISIIFIVDITPLIYIYFDCICIYQ